MRLIANKPCSFGGERFYIGDEIPEGMVADPAVQEKRGILTILKGGAVAVDLGDISRQEGLFTREAVEVLIAEAVAAAEREKEAQFSELQEHAAELREIEPGAFVSLVPVTIFGEEEDMTVRLFPEEINQVFAVMQLKADEGVKMIEDVTSENVLILLHAADSRKTIKNAAKEQADKLSLKEAKDESRGGNEAAGTLAEGS